MSFQGLQAKVRLALTGELPVYSASDEIEEILGFMPEDFLSSKVGLKKQIHPGDSRLADMLFSPDVRTGCGEFNLRFRHADGRIRCVKMHCAKAVSVDGQVIADLLLQEVFGFNGNAVELSNMAIFRAMMDSSEDYIYFKNRNHVFIAASQIAMPASNMRIHDVLGKTDYDLLRETSADALYALEEQIFAGLPMGHMVHEIEVSPGKRCCVDNRMYPIRSENGNIIGIWGIARDITERVEAEEALRQSEEVLRESQRVAGLGSYVLDIGNEVWTGSRVLEDVFGIDAGYPHTVEGWKALIYPADRDMITSHFRDEVIGKHDAFDREYRIIRPSDQTVRWVHELGRLKFDDQGQPVSMSGTIQDISIPKLAEQNLCENKELLQLFVEHAPASLAMFDREMRYLVVSHRYLADNGLEDTEIIGHSYYEIFPYIPDCWRAAHRRGLAGEALQVNEDRYEDFSENARWARWQLHPWLTGTGEVGGIVIFSEDITERKEAEMALRESKDLLQLFIEHAPASLAMFDREMRYLAASRRYLEDVGLAGREFIGHCGYEMFPEIPERWKEDDRRALAGEVVFFNECSVIRADGTVHWVRRAVHPWLTGDGEVGGIVSFSEDISERKNAEDKLRLAARVFTHASEGILITAPDGTIIDVNDAFTAITGYKREDVLGRNPRMLSSGLQQRDFYAAMWNDLLEKGQWSGEIWNRTKSGHIYPEMLTISAVKDERGEIRQYVGLFSDITRTKEHERQLEQIAHYDVLTDLPNRALLIDRLRQAMARARRRNQMLAVAYLDLDGFKAINDSFGHEIGDRLLAAVAGRMKAELRGSDTLARLGGDEFVAVIFDLKDRESSIPTLNRLLKAVSKPMQIDIHDIQISVSIGVTVYPQSEDVDADQLLRQADQAMYQAKLAGRNRYYIFDVSQDRNARSRHVDLDRIRQALAAHEFVLYYQPMVNMGKGTVVGAEALIRWQHPEQGLLLPGSFLPIIEDHPLAVEVGDWVIDTALTQMERWQDEGLDMPVSVNVGARQLQDPSFVDRLARLLVAHPRIRPSQLELEIVETSALRDMSQISQMLQECREIGVTFALDDFGTGYSSLSYLRHLPTDVLKIDRSFVCDILSDPEDLTILEGILGLAAAFSRRFVAEGVETVDHGLMLLRLGCELAQGFAIAHPIPADDFPRWMLEWCPDPRWNNVSLSNPSERQLLLAAVEHRSWIAALESFLKNDRHVPPRLNLNQCRFSVWMAANKLSGYGNSSGFQTLDYLHKQIHELAVDIVKFKDQDNGSDPMARMCELHNLLRELLKQLEIYGQS